MSDFYHRSLAKAKRTDVRAVHARCSILDLQVDRLLEIAPTPEDQVPEISPDNHKGEIETVASMARVRMQVPSGPITNLVKAVEACGAIVIDRHMEVDDIDALCRWVPGLPKLFFVNGAKPADRIRFSLAHELGHTIMHFGRDVNLMDAERQANEFASAFLMPAQEFRRDVRYTLSLADLAALKRKWRVSMQAIARRAYSLSLIDDSRYKSICVQMSRNGWRKTEPVSIERESPMTFVSLIRAHVDAGYTKSDLSQLLFISEAAVEELLSDQQAPNWEQHGVRLRLVR